MKNNKLVLDYMPLAYSIAAKNRNKGVEYEELKAVAILALVTARDKYDPARGSFGTIALLSVRSAVRDALVQQYRRINLTWENNPLIGDSGSDCLVDSIPDQSPSAYDIVQDKQKMKLITNQLDSLDIRKRFVIEQRYLTPNKEPTLKELGGVLGVSFQRVNEMELRAIDIIREGVYNEIGYGL